MPSQELVSFREVLAGDLKDPTFRAEWARTALARPVAIAIVRYRVDHKLSQTALAKRLGMRQPHIARLELGEHNPSVEMLQRLSAALGLRFIVDVAPAGELDVTPPLVLPELIQVVEDVASDGSRITVAAGRVL